MSRPHTEFIQTQALNWRTIGEKSTRPGAQEKRLSVDPDSRACTVLLRHPKGWSFDEEHYLDDDEEIFVLSGALTIGDVTYSKGDYAYLPAGYPRPHMSAPDGADVLTYLEGEHKRITGQAPEGGFDPSILVERISTEQVAWGGATDPNVASAGVRRLALRKDPKTGDTTWLLDIDETGMGDEVNRLETHPVVEEVFIISGEMHMPQGVLKQGAYFWRPPDIPHGPVGTKTGSLGIFRCKGGPLTTDWSEETYPVQWNAPYNPELPEDVRETLADSYDESLPY